MPLFRHSRRPRSSEGKTYLYVSDAKVSMLIDGLEPSLLQRFDLKGKVRVPGVIGGEVGLRQAECGRYARAERLCTALESNGLIGSIDGDTKFFRGQLLAAWGFWNRHDKGYADVVFFHGFADKNTFVGLGGSAYHTMERAGDRMQQYSNSGIQTLMASLRSDRNTRGRTGTRPLARGPPRRGKRTTTIGPYPSLLSSSDSVTSTTATS